jgi:3-phenylpropionate/cinnamic acid dioxygenase small subunit
MDVLQQIQEIEAIKQLKYRYMRCIDQKLWDEMRECFTPDATTSYSGGKYAFEGIDAIMEFMTESMSRPSFLSSHRVHHPEIELTGDTTAAGRWALEDYVIDTQHDITIHGAAFYTDRYVKVDGAWKIQHTGYERTFEEMGSRKGQGWRVTQRAFGD